MNALTTDEASVPQFYIAASSALQERRTLTLKHGDTFAVFDHRGDMSADTGSSEGLYHRDTRILSHFKLLLEEARPLLLSSMTQDDNAIFSADLSNPDLLRNGQSPCGTSKSTCIGSSSSGTVPATNGF